ncbi:DUF1631 domain-containing protein [Massilia sp. G4R7]|uniref:DUF1631 domain-containing protein n=1 Tax=Massilia phyllostachyos TaxID=2898585 RepID=A0ABS8QCJ2_9BURK|nr:DUF1631 family protein [Massilia phyllostachyos]MCD2519471.1 DUF1631 domain-containing protein [Massilia phyllostachyos]
MDSSTAQTPAVRKAAAAQQAALDELVAVAATHATEALPDVVQRMSALLLDMTAAGTDTGLAVRRIRSGNLLKDNSYAYVHLASTGIELALRKEAALLLPANNKQVKQAPLTLSLVPMEEMDDQVAFSGISRPFDIACSEPLAGLGVRLGLLLGRDLVRASHNPFRPEVFLRALQDAWREFEPDTGSHELILPLLRQGVVFEFGPLLELLADKLKPARGAERFAKTDDSAAARAARARRDAAVSEGLRQLFGGADAAPGADLDIPLIANLPQGSGGWRPSGAAGFAVAAPAPTMAPNPAPQAGPQTAAQGAPGQAAGQHVATQFVPAGVAAPAGVPMAAIPAPLIEVLEKLAAGGFATVPAAQAAAQASTPAQDVFYLPRLKQSLPQGSLSRGDETTLDLLSRIFETVLLDESIPQETRELIAFLQVPVLKAALKDRSFFFEEQHPARRMLDLLSNVGWEQQGGEDDPVYRAMRRGVEKVRQQAQPEAFAAAVAELEAGIAERERIEERAIAGPIAQATRQEKQAAATRSAKKAVATRLAGEQVVALVGAFLEQRWTPVLTLAYTIEDSKPGAIDNATRAMDELIWSVKPKATNEERKALISRLPGLLTTLNKWLDATRWQDAERLQFFAELAECHASIVRAPIEVSPERQLELAVEAAQQDAMRRIAQEQAAAQEEAVQEERQKDPAAASLAALVRGMRVEFNGKEGIRKLKLAWVSPLRTLFIFSGAGKKEAFSLPAERLLDGFRAGSIRVLAPEGVVGRVLTQAAGEAAMNDASHGPMQAAS